MSQSEYFEEQLGKVDDESVAELTALIAQGVYPPGTPQLHPLAEGPEVLRQLEARQTHGKHALDPWR